jgi:carboxyl-terminal processing protease
MEQQAFGEINSQQSEPASKPGQPGNHRRFAMSAVLVVLAFGLGFGIGQDKFTIEDGKIEIVKGNQKADYNLLWDALELLNEKFVDKDELDQRKLLYGAISGLMSATGDPYTVFFDPLQSKEFRDELKGSFEGIGAEIGMREGQIVVIAPLEGTPAAKAGILPGDMILSINGESTVNMTVDQAVSKIRGKAGTEVRLDVLHKDLKQPTEIAIIRGLIEVKSVKLEVREVDGKKYAVIKLVRFGDDTRGLFNHVADIILSSNFNGIVLDLRNNPGGYLDASVNIAGNWVENGQVVVKEVFYQGNIKEYKAEGINRFRGIRTVVLVNGGSASASEILAGALKDHNLATIVGEKTFGKGSVQELSEFSDRSTIKITVAKWLTPGGKVIEGNGLEPDIAVERTQEDVLENRDPQLDKALELLR